MPITEKDVQKGLWIVLAVMTFVQAVIHAERGDLPFSLIFIALTIGFIWQTVRMFKQRRN